MRNKVARNDESEGEGEGGEVRGGEANAHVFRVTCSVAQECQFAFESSQM